MGDSLDWTYDNTTSNKLVREINRNDWHDVIWYSCIWTQIMIRFLCLTLLVVCLIPNQVLLYSPFRFRFRAFPESSNLVPNVNSNQGFRFHQKRSYGDLDCGGMYDPSIFAQLDGICEDCYNLYRSPEVHGLCRKDCFSSETFRQCLQSLLLEEDSAFYMNLVQIIGKKKK